jgi:Ca2+-binding EF-hand superfamily protein
LDEKHDGTITRKELEAGLKKFIPEIETNEINEIFTSLDSDGSGTIDYEEFLRTCLDKAILHDVNTLQAIFDNFEKNGIMSIENLMVSLNMNVDENDKDKDNSTICFEEFKRMMAFVKG